MKCADSRIFLSLRFEDATSIFIEHSFSNQTDGAQMETMLVECNMIDLPEIDRSRRTLSKKFVEELADTIELDGLLNPILLRPNLNSAGRYLLVAGRQRLDATMNVLEEKYIRATILEDMEDEEASIAADVENLCRNPLNSAQQAGAVKRWHERWVARFRVEFDAKAPINHNDKSDNNSGGDTERAEAKSEGRSEAEFDKRVSAATGQSKATVRRVKAIAKTFTKQQLEILGMVEASQVQMLTIAMIKNREERREVVDLFGKGVDIDAAIATVMGKKDHKRYNETKEVNEAKNAAKAEKQPGLSDDEWFEQNCGEKAAKVRYKTQFKADALLYRALIEATTLYRVKVKSEISKANERGLTGRLFNLVSHHLSIGHPKDWPLCDKCCGDGVVEADDDQYYHEACPKCNASGYLFQTQENNII